MFNFLVIYILEAKASYGFFLTRYLVTEMEEISVNFITIFKYNIIMILLIIFFKVAFTNLKRII